MDRVLNQDFSSSNHDSRWDSAAWRGKVRRRLIKWFGDHQRDLPWRESCDPYRVWISEVMLQQTQVATAIEYFNRFQQRFPNVATLASADEQEVLRYWEGLGYYRRARQLHAAAQVIVRDHGGEFPLDFANVLALPGIGRYTAGAILSISEDQRHPVVEANTQRLYARLIGLRDATSTAASQRLLWHVAEQLLPRKSSGTFNQAAMELGSLVCKPRNPECHQCPLAALCTAFEQGLQDLVPGKTKKLDYVDRNEVAIIVRDVDKYFVRLCLPGERWEGLWDFPRCEVGDPSDSGKSAKEHLLNAYAQRVGKLRRIMELKHGVTKYRISLAVYMANSRTKPSVSEDHVAWKSADEISSLPLSSTGRKIWKTILADASR